MSKGDIMKNSNIETLKNWIDKDAEPIRPNKFERKKYKKHHPLHNNKEL